MGALPLVPVQLTETLVLFVSLKEKTGLLFFSPFRLLKLVITSFPWITCLPRFDESFLRLRNCAEVEEQESDSVWLFLF